MAISKPNTSKSTPETQDRGKTEQTVTRPTYFERFTRLRLVGKILLCIVKVALTLFGSVALYQFVTNGGANFVIPFTEIIADFDWLLKSLPLSKMFIQVGPVTVFISPLSFSPFALPDFIPFKQSFVCVKLWDLPVPLEELFINLHVLPTLYVYLPSLSSFSLSPLRLPRFPVSLSLVSLSTVFHPIEVIGAQLICPLWSLLTLRLSNVRLRMRLFPGHRQMPKASASSVMSPETSVDTEDVHLDIADVEPPVEPPVELPVEQSVETSVDLLEEYLESLDTHVTSDSVYVTYISTFQDYVFPVLFGLWIHASQTWQM